MYYEFIKLTVSNIGIQCLAFRERFSQRLHWFVFQVRWISTCCFHLYYIFHLCYTFHLYYTFHIIYYTSHLYYTFHIYIILFTYIVLFTYKLYDSLILDIQHDNKAWHLQEVQDKHNNSTLIVFVIVFVFQRGRYHHRRCGRRHSLFRIVHVRHELNIQ